MSTPPPTRAAWLGAGLLILAFLMAASLPYSWLIAHFGYDDILREPAADILTRFHAGGPALVTAWLAFGLGALLFIPAALALERLLPVRGALPLAIASATAQAIGLLRWVLVVPGLAGAYVDPAASPATRDALVVVFDAVHHYGGMVIGEMVGQLLLAGWTALVSFELWLSRALPRGLAVMGALTLPLWLLGQSELLHAHIPAIPRVEVVPLAFMGWEAWLLALAMACLVKAWRT